MDIWQASLAEDSKRLAQLLTNKQNRTLVNKRNTNGYTPLHLAAYSGHYENVKLLLTHSADPNMKDKNKNQWTSCHWSAITGNIRVLLLLCESGGKIDVTDTMDKTPLDYLLQAQKGDRIKRDFDLMVFTWGNYYFQLES
jgi:ankyrin repeat protein